MSYGPYGFYEDKAKYPLDDLIDTADYFDDGVLPISHGGTGKTTANAAQNALIGGAPLDNNTPTDTTQVVIMNPSPSDANGAVEHTPLSKFWDYIKSKIDSVYGFVNEILPVSNGGTGVNSAPAGTVFAGPESGSDAAPSFRALTNDDLPSSVKRVVLFDDPSGKTGEVPDPSKDPAIYYPDDPDKIVLSQSISDFDYLRIYYFTRSNTGSGSDHYDCGSIDVYDPSTPPTPDSHTWKTVSLVTGHINKWRQYYFLIERLGIHDTWLAPQDYGGWCDLAWDNQDPLVATELSTVLSKFGVEYPFKIYRVEGWTE